ncbi:MAG: hypothetical protein R2865_12260 [Deinococcales bacterium]
MMADLADHATGYCNACFTGNYPISLEGGESGEFGTVFGLIAKGG